MPLLCTFVDDAGYRCKTRPLYGYPNLGANFCKIHKKDDMKMVYGKTFCPCGVRPSFGYDGEKATCCAKCKKTDMINVTKQLKCPCGTRASFGYEGQKPTCCSKCKKTNMIDIRKRNMCPCGTRASFGYEGQKPTCCSKCKLDDMIDVTTRNICPCGVRASYGYQGEKPSCCSKCKLDDMLDTEHLLCPCGIRALYGYEGQKASSCIKCKLDNMINVNSSRCLCGKTPKYGFPKGLATCCTICKEEGMINIYNDLCKANEEPYNILCPVLGNKKYAGFCTHCFAHLFPDNPLTALIRKNSKEIQVVNYITTRYDGFIHDKPFYVDFDGDCCASKRRIDLRKFVDGTTLCIEIDEGQHKRYSNIDEISRYNEIFMDFSSKYIFIRYNPDQYKDKNNKTKRPQLNTRMETLEKEINKHIDRIKQNKNIELLEIHHLFFNEI